MIPEFDMSRRSAEKDLPQLRGAAERFISKGEARRSLWRRVRKAGICICRPGLVLLASIDGQVGREGGREGKRASPLS